MTRRRLRWAAGLSAYLAALWLLWPTPAAWPLRVFVVLLHELGHAAAAVASGGTVERIMLSHDEGGATWALGGSPFLILSAGYLGSLLFGLAMLIAAGARPRPLRIALAVLAGIVLAATALLVRGAFGLVFGALAGAALLLAAWRAPTSAQRILLTLLGLTSAIYALLDIRSDILRRPDLPSDAALLAELTGVPTLVWGLLWFAAGATLAGLLLRREFRRA